jgi:hypothetical protein
MDILDLVTLDLKARHELGNQRFGRAMQAHDGRFTLQDAYEESLDLAMYLRKEIAEREQREDERDIARAADDGMAGIPILLEAGNGR